MRAGIVITLCLCVVSICAQEYNHERMSFSIEYSKHRYAMDSLNEYYFDFVINEFNFLEKNISSGNYFAVLLAFRPTRMIEVGIKPYYQFGRSQHSSPILVYGNSPEPIETQLFLSQTTRSYGILLSSSLYVNQMLSKPTNRMFFSRLSYAPEVNFGIGFNSIFGYSIFSDYTVLSEAENAGLFKNTSFFSQVGLKLEYAVLQKSIITSIGFRAGYQFFKTGRILRESGEEMLTPTGRVSHLDFSGFYYGIYLKFGK